MKDYDHEEVLRERQHQNSEEVPRAKTILKLSRSTKSKDKVCQVDYVHLEADL